MSTAEPLALEEQAWKPTANPWLITIAVMLGTFMEVLDTSVANVALPHIAGNLSASTDESTWVLTSYLVSNAIVLPATGWLSRYFGRKRFLVACIALFTLASLACGAATSLPMLIVARIVQGAGGGALQPIAQAILLESFPVAKRGLAMAAYTLGIVFAPVIGPTIGGWITDNYSWRWVFYINIPVGVLAVLMVNALVEDPPYLTNSKPGRIDAIGLGLLAIWIAVFQIILDKGQEADWFGAVWIRWATLLTVVALAAFIYRELTIKEPLVDLRTLKNRNFLIGTILVFVVGIVLYGTTALIPLFLQELLGYPALQSGLAISPRGIGSIVAILIIGRLVGKIDSRFLIGTALAMLAYSSFLLGRVTMDITPMNVTWPIIINGAAISMLFVPLTTITTGTIPREQIGNAAGIYNLMRNLGGSVGISMMTTLLTRTAQREQVVLAGHITPYDPAVQQRLATLQEALARQSDWVTAGQQARGMLYNQVQQQAELWAFVSNFRLMAVLCLLSIPLVFFFQAVKPPAGPVAVH